MAKAKMSAQRASAMNVFKSARTLRDATNKTWAVAPKCPMFTRKSKPTSTTTGPDGKTIKKKKVVRTNRLIGGHAYQIVASGAAAYANAVMQREAGILRQSIDKEKKRMPWLPRPTKGAIALIEQFLCAYAQEATRHASSVRTGLNTGKRLNEKLMRTGFDEADEAIFGGAMLVPRCPIVLKLPSKKAASKGGAEKGKQQPADEEDADYEPPQADEADE